MRGRAHARDDSHHHRDALMYQRRILILMGLILLCALGVLGRLCQLQVFEGDYYRTRSDALAMDRVLSPGRRGDIRDATGIVLAKDEPAWEVRWNYWLFTDAESVLARLAYLGAGDLRDGHDPGDAMTGQAGAAMSALDNVEGAARAEDVQDGNDDHTPVGATGFNSEQLTELGRVLNDLSQSKHDRALPSYKRLYQTWEQRRTHMLMRAEVERGLARLAHLLQVPLLELLKKRQRVEQEISLAIAEARGSSKAFMSIVRLGSNPIVWDDFARAERRERRQQALADDDEPPARYQENPIVLAKDVPRFVVETLSELDYLFPGITVHPSTRRRYPESLDLAVAGHAERISVASHLLGYLREIERVGFTPKPGESEELVNSPHYLRIRDKASHDVGDAFVEAYFTDHDAFTSEFRTLLLRQQVGVTGLERQYDLRLQGAFGIGVVQRDARGRVIEVMDEVEPVPAGALDLTLMLPAQRVAEQALFDVFASTGCPGAVVVLDARTGAILVCASSPGYDLERLMGSRPRDREYQNYLFNADEPPPGNPMFNRAIHGTPAPGSVIKLITAIAAMEEGVLVGPEYQGLKPCAGYWDVAREKWGVKRGFNCHGGHAVHGQLAVPAALEVSCNCFFHECAYQLGYEALRKWLGLFGLGEMTGVDFAEYAGWRDGRDGSRYNWLVPAMQTNPGDGPLLAIGQGKMRASPLQIARAMTPFATGGYLTTPRFDAALLSAIDEQTGVATDALKLPISRDSLEQVRLGMHQVVFGSRGTANTRALRELFMAGKTGTAQSGKKRGNQELDYAWFAGIAPYAPDRADLTPRYAYAVYIEHTTKSGGKVAAPIAASVIEALMEAQPVEEAGDANTSEE